VTKQKYINNIRNADLELINVYENRDIIKSINFLIIALMIL